MEKNLAVSSSLIQGYYKKMALTFKEFIKLDNLLFQYVVLRKRARRWNMLEIEKLEKKATKEQINKLNRKFKSFSQFYK